MVPQNKSEDEMMRMLFGEEIGDFGNDGLDGSKEEHQIFKEVFYGNSVNACNSAAGITSIQTYKRSSCTEGSVDVNHSSMKDSSVVSIAHVGMKAEDRNDAGCVLGSSSYAGGGDADGVNVKQPKLSSTDHVNRDPDQSLLDASSDLASLASLKVGAGVPVPDSLIPCQTTPCSVVEAYGRGVISTGYLFTHQREVDGTDDANNMVIDGNHGNPHAEDDNVDTKAKHAASPITQDGLLFGLLETCAPATSEEPPGALVSMNLGAQETGVIDLARVDAKKGAKQMIFMRDLPPRLELHAHRLLVDAGWKIEPHKRCGRTKLAFNFRASNDGPLHSSLVKAWKACGNQLYANASNSDQDANGREWKAINQFWADFLEVLEFFDKEDQHPENSMPLLRRWQLLDPFMAVVWIDKRVGALREGKALRAVNSATTFLKDRADNLLPEQNSSPLNSKKVRHPPAHLSSGDLEVFEGSCNDQALVVQDHNDLQNECRCGHVVSNDLHKRSLRSLARCIGQGLQNVKCLKCNASTNQPKKENRTSSKFTSIQKGFCTQDAPVCPVNDFLAQGSASPNKDLSTSFDSESSHMDDGGNLSSRADSSSMCIADLPINQKEFNISSGEVEAIEVSKSETENASVKKPVNSSNKKTRKKSKKISEIQSTQVKHKDMRAKVPFRNCEEEFDSIMAERSQQEEAVRLRGTSERPEQAESFKKPSGNVFDAPSVDTAHVSAATEAGSIMKTHKKAVKSVTKVARRDAKHNQDNLRMHMVDESRSTLLTSDKGQEDKLHLEPIEREGNTKRLSLSKSTFESLSEHKRSSKSRKRWHLFSDSEGKLIGDGDEIYAERHCVNEPEKASFFDVSASPEQQKSQKGKDVKQTEVYKETGRKRPRGCRIDDDDLLIAAIIKKKDFSSFSKPSASKLGGSDAKEVLRKLKGQTGSRKLLLRTPGKAGNHSINGKKVTFGARTVLCWLIEMGALVPKDVIEYRNPKNNEVIKDGWVTREGILCKCCTELFCVSDFVAHTGLKTHRASLNLFLLPSGKSYTLCQLKAWRSEYKARTSGKRMIDTEDVDQNDDTCGLCGDGGELICCDNCPSTYHQLCLAEQELPEGNWYCPNCICRTCENAVHTKEAPSSTVLECSQCERKYHDSCMRDKITCDEDIGADAWFCGGYCQQIYVGLRSRVGIMNCLGDGFSWSILRCHHGEQKVHSAQKIALMAECNSKLAISLTLMEECFLPMVDPRTGIDMIPHVLYNGGSKFARLDYKGFYTVILEKNDELISVASIRVHGVRVAEMPLIATSSGHRRQGMCKRLMNAIEEMLKSFNVEMLVISAIPSLVDTWTLGFGFKAIEDDERNQLIDANLMLFPGTTMLKKDLHEAICKESGVNSDIDLGEDEFRNLSVSIGNTIIDTAHQYVETVQKSSLQASMNLPLDQVMQMNTLASSFENPDLLTSNNEQVNAKNTDSCTLRTSTPNIMVQYSPIEQAVSSQLSLSYSGSFSSQVTDSEPPTDSSCNKTYMTGVAERTVSENIDIITEDTAACINSLIKNHLGGDGIEKRHYDETSEENCNLLISQSLSGLGPFMGVSNLNKGMLEMHNTVKVSADDSSSTSKDEACDSVPKLSAVVVCTGGKLKAHSNCSASEVSDLKTTKGDQTGCPASCKSVLHSCEVKGFAEEKELSGICTNGHSLYDSRR